MCAASPTSVNSDTSAGSSMETDMAVLDFVVGSPSNSEVSVISQALSPVEISNEPENTELLSPQEQDTVRSAGLGRSVFAVDCAIEFVSLVLMCLFPFLFNTLVTT